MRIETMSLRGMGGVALAAVLAMGACAAEEPLSEDQVREVLDRKHRRDITVELPLGGTLERAKTDPPGRSNYDKAKLTYECLQQKGFGTYALSPDEELEAGIRNTYTFTPSDTLLAAKVEGGGAEKLSLKACTAQVASVESIVPLTRETRKVKATMGSSENPAWLECLWMEGGLSLASLEAKRVCGGQADDKVTSVEATLVKGESGWDVMRN
ncbi:hypothetical protein L6R50_08780 [Myxococcota bacterium]|nr:hypothetical protein [Myxococcota bacterium]